MEKERAAKLATEVFESCRNQTYFQLHYLEHALFYLKPEERENISTGSDGRKLYYGADYLLKRYLQSPDAVNCDYLHTVFHCLYQHPLQAKEYDRRYWDLAADIAVTDVMGELSLPQITGEIPEQCFVIVERLKREVPLMSALYIARYLALEEDSLETAFGLNIEEMQELFARDEHTFWNYRTMPETERQQNREKRNRQENETETEKEGRRGQKLKKQIESESEPKSEAGSESGWESETDAESDSQLREDWNEIAESVMLSAQSFAKTRSELPGSMVQTLQRLTRETYDYTDFLKKFAVLEECMKLNPDEFDYLYYLYGLNHLGRIALIEPLEYKEEYLVRDFVIAIDTSGSCSGELVQRFLNKTYNILKSMESFTRKVVIHVIQCDCVIQNDTVIESLDDLEAYMEHLEIKGLGGTDFRPVFAYVDELCAKKAFRDLRGLIYFTDGYGIFPGQPPKYKTAFVFLDREDQVWVPPWAMRMYLEGEAV